MEDDLLDIDIDIDEAKIGSPFYCCYLNLENLKVVETWIYQGYQKWERTDPDCDTPHHYYVFALHGGDPRSPYQVGIPRKLQVERSMLTWGMLAEAMAELDSATFGD